MAISLSSNNFDFFDVSIIMPFYKKFSIFKKTIIVNEKYFSRNGIEVIICLDEPSEEAPLLDLIAEYPFINFKIVINRSLHSWRNPAKVINVGIRQARFKYVLVIGPDSECQTDIILQFRQYAMYYDNSYFIGQVTFQSLDEQIVEHLGYLPYGSIFVDRTILLETTGYNEQFSDWGGDDDELRARLEFAGMVKIFVPEAKLIHYDEKEAGHISRTNRSSNIPVLVKKIIFLPSQKKVNPENWGTDFSEILFDYNNNLFAFEQLTKYVQSFEKFEIATKFKILATKKIIALLPVYNEEKNISKILSHLENICDGVILIDDGSIDKTYELAKSSNLLIKAKRKRANHTEERIFRNQLLDLAHFCNSEWLFFIDADEELDLRFTSLYNLLENSLSDSICFYLVHLWNDTNTYRTNVPEVSPIGSPGILHRWRMFRKKGYLQIPYGSMIHVQCVPYKMEKHLAPVLIMHYGMVDSIIRFEKAKKYKVEDPLIKENPTKYDYFDDQEVSVSHIKEIRQLPSILIKNEIVKT